ncbi:probable ubiquitin-like-specific protease 2B isoform X2 [Salvia splendens]|uniref:probable ubiquitin-like-specific protease 2B isoform X2 n=1 Tax=Salvia splendens TaxID=180675 RepID=UPI001C273164|nr:probable ubiquitin-like-specific protease 2B isoform X2 [Salvia splendens]
MFFSSLVNFFMPCLFLQAIVICPLIFGNFDLSLGYKKHISLESMSKWFYAGISKVGRPRAKGRKRKNKSKQDEFSDVEATVPLGPRKKVGRPRKNVLKQDESSDVEVTVPLCPRKNVLKQDESSDVKATVPLRPRAKRRKRKNVLKHDESSTVEVTVPKNIHRRGHARQSRISNCTITTERGKLDSGRFLCYLMHMWDGLPEEKVESATYFDPLWFEMYANRDRRANVLSWIKEKGILSKKCVFVPIVKWSHWSLLIMYNLGQSLDSETNAPCLLLLDSLQGMDPKRLEPSIRRLLIDIYESEERTESKKELQKIPLWIPEVPQQKEGNECGFYVLFYIRCFIDSPPQSFNVSKGNPNMMGKDWFTNDQVENFCKELEALPSVTDPDPASYDSSDSIEIVTAPCFDVLFQVCWL